MPYGNSGKEDRVGIGAYFKRNSVDPSMLEVRTRLCARVRVCMCMCMCVCLFLIYAYACMRVIKVIDKSTLIQMMENVSLDNIMLVHT
jgi:hypothetical protein